MAKSLSKIVTSLSLLLILGAHSSVGQAVQPKQYTLEEAVKTALEKNPDLVSARLEVQRADARVHEAWGTALPSLDLSGQYSRAIKKPVFFLPNFFENKPDEIIAVEVGSNHAVNVGVTATQVLFNSAVIVGVGAAKIYSGAARELYRAKELETVTKVRKAFYAVLVAGEVRKMMQETLKNAQGNLANVQLMAKQGVVSEYDQLRATVGVENLQPSVIQAENNYALALDGLRAMMGLEVTERFDVEGALQFQPMDEAEFTNATETVLEANPGLRAMRMQVDVNRAMVNIERSDYFPTLAAFGNYQYQVAKNTLNIGTHDFIASSTVGLSISMNIFKGLQTNARVEQAQLEVQKSQEQLTGLETNLRTGVHSAILQLQQTRKRVEAQTRTVEQAEKGYALATTRFTSGAGTQLEVNDAQLALTQAHVNRIQAIYDYLVASADFDQLTGHLPSYVVSNEEK
jgi:outer membrane protein